MQIPGYKIEGLLAKGGMSQVFLAEQESLQRQVVLKVLDPGVDPTVQERFLHEGRLIASLDHRNVITIYDVGSCDGHHYLAMEYLQGGDLAKKINQGLRPQVSLKIVQAIAASLQYVHAQGVVHGDIKPANILFRKDGTPILTDFGIAKRDGDQRIDDGLFVSPYYVSPEQAQSQPYDGRADIYSLGVVLYEALTGSRPYVGKDELDTIAKAIHDPLPTLPPIYSKIQPVLDKMLAKAPHKRFQSARQVADALYELRKDKSLTFNRIDEGKTIPLDQEALNSVLESESHPLLRRGNLLRALVITLLVGGAGLWFYQEQSKQWLWFVGGNAKAPKETSAQRASDDAEAATTETATDNTDANPNVVTVEVPEQAINDEKQALQAALKQEQQALEKVREERLRLEQEAKERARLEAEKAEQARKAEQLAAQRLEQQRELERQQQIRQLLAKADRKLKEYRLTTPLNDNALYYYQQVLSMDPGNAKAKQGIDNVAQRYAWLAQQQIDKFEYKKARYYIDLGLTIRPEHEGLLALKKEATILKEPGRMVNRIERLFDGL